MLARMASMLVAGCANLLRAAHRQVRSQDRQALAQGQRKAKRKPWPRASGVTSGHARHPSRPRKALIKELEFSGKRQSETKNIVQERDTPGFIDWPYELRKEGDVTSSWPSEVDMQPGTHAHRSPPFRTPIVTIHRCSRAAAVRAHA